MTKRSRFEACTLALPAGSAVFEKSRFDRYCDSFLPDTRIHHTKARGGRTFGNVGSCVLFDGPTPWRDPAGAPLLTRRRRRLSARPLARHGPSGGYCRRERGCFVGVKQRLWTSP